MSQTVQVGALTLALELLKVGELKRVRDAIVAVIGMKKTELPTAEQIDAMVAIVFASASKRDPQLTIAQLTAAFDELPYDTGILTLTEALGAVFKASGIKPAVQGTGPGDLVLGEAGSPASSISPGSTD